MNEWMSWFWNIWKTDFSAGWWRENVTNKGKQIIGLRFWKKPGNVVETIRFKEELYFLDVVNFTDTRWKQSVSFRWSVFCYNCRLLSYGFRGDTTSVCSGQSRTDCHIPEGAKSALCIWSMLCSLISLPTNSLRSNPEYWVEGRSNG